MNEGDLKTGTAQPIRTGKSRRPARLRRFRRKALRKIGRSRFVNWLAGAAIHRVLRFVARTQTPATDFAAVRLRICENHPAIVGMWHGQHLLAPIFRPVELPYVALLSRNADAEINAQVVARFGIDTVRGSGGREGGTKSEKGGARAVIALRKALREGFGVCMIADVPKGTPREAGHGIVTLARISGRPILPSAAVTSRRRVVRSSWDQTTLPLPFGRMAVVVGEPIHVPADADAALLEEKRREVTRAIEAANRDATRIVEARR
ncbi:lysophospholipid acyltransferase family protein [Fulvimarina sp. 2208YS6-2-32]|uniref:Lysophospholipid acyltransferase family protein n=1 Tax=Fulvimarina uroteuthidis TaxID=3098149 RepID=A0ABU5I1T8_9HYPH|nr:lysophospholipid acyltransferase family protein [Fulvimarina sp. 2208YS6-2-32]MDY8109337.1 lysophospholipid acyltransferase family protein [Fulvimarina sp. 2208YS6-2-32]